MKIEKINDRQIRCTLTKADLESRQIKISELAYGSEKARALFREMLTQAFRDFGFEANNIPLMIEAIPSGGDQLVLLVTKVSNPEELDGHFSQFSTEQGKGADNNMNFSDALSGADDILKLFDSLGHPAGRDKDQETENSADKKAAKNDAAAEDKPIAGSRLSSEDLERLIEKTGKFLNDMEAFTDADTLRSLLGGEEEDMPLPYGKDPSKKDETEPLIPHKDQAAQPSHPDRKPKSSKKGQASDPSDRGSASAAPRPGQMAPGFSIPKKANSLTEEELYQYTRFYLFRDLESVVKVSKRIGEEYKGENSLYKNPDDAAYYLLVRKQDTGAELFNRICNLLSEYSLPMDYATGMEEFFREHMKIIIKDDALQQLRAL